MQSTCKVHEKVSHCILFTVLYQIFYYYYIIISLPKVEYPSKVKMLTFVYNTNVNDKNDNASGDDDMLPGMALLSLSPVLKVGPCNLNSFG